MVVAQGEWFIDGCFSVLTIRLVAHLELNHSSSAKLGVGEIEPRVGYTIKQHALHIAVTDTQLGGLYYQMFAVRQSNIGLSHKWSPDDVLISTRTHGIETKRSENVPCRHLSAVVVAAEAIDGIAVHLAHNRE